MNTSSFGFITSHSALSQLPFLASPLLHFKLEDELRQRMAT
jgi:hypothetical protein